MTRRGIDGKHFSVVRNNTYVYFAVVFVSRFFISIFLSLRSYTPTCRIYRIHPRVSPAPSLVRFTLASAPKRYDGYLQGRPRGFIIFN